LDGPFTETKEVIAGYDHSGEIEGRGHRGGEALFQSRGRRKQGEIEVRQLFELEDFGPSEAIERFREIGVAPKK
jgi:hypothetical protein